MAADQADEQAGRRCTGAATAIATHTVARAKYVRVCVCVDMPKIKHKL